MRLARVVPGLVVAALVCVATRAMAKSVVEEYDAEGNGPWGHTTCPNSFPSALLWSPSISRFWHVPKWNLPAGDEVPFNAGAKSKYLSISVPPGFGAFSPDNTSAFYENEDWTWDTDNHQPYVIVECFERTIMFGMDFQVKAEYTGEFAGYAFPVIGDDEGDDGTDTRANGTSEGGQQCWEMYEWWIDDTGYHEIVLDSWCDDAT